MKRYKTIECCKNCGTFFSAVVIYNEKGISINNVPKYCKLCESRGFKNE